MTTTTKEDTPLTGPWSYSRATSCARALFMDKVERAPQEPRPERFLALDRRSYGKLLHEGADRMLLAVNSGEPWPNAKALAHELLTMKEGDIVPYAHLSSEAADIEMRLQLFADSFRVEYDMTQAERDARVRNNMLGCEMKLAFDADGNKAPFAKCPPDGWRGVVDYAEDVGDRTLLIIDGKNRPAMFTRSELLADEQLSSYAWLGDSEWPGQFDTFIVGIYYFQFGVTQLVTLSREQMEANVRRLRARGELKAAMPRSSIVPEPGFGKCQYCDYLTSCDAGQELMAGGKFAPTDADGARQLAGWLMVNEERVKAARKALQTFTAEFGPLELDDATRIGYAVSRDGVSYDKNKTLRILKAQIDAGVLDAKLADFTNLNVTAVKKAAKIKTVDEALKPARSPREDSKFEFFRPGKKKGTRMAKVGRGKKPVAEDLPERSDFADATAGGMANVIGKMQDEERKTRARVRGARKDTDK